MPKKTVTVVCWNCGNKTPGGGKDTELPKVVQAINDTQPDIIAVATQELSSPGKFKTALLQSFGGFYNAGSNDMCGITKIADGMTHTAICVLAKNADKNQYQAPNEGGTVHHRPSIKTATKGAATVNLLCGTLRLSFSSLHLPVGGDIAKREAMARGVVNTTWNNRPNPNKTPIAIFLAGDMNCRMASCATIKTHTELAEEIIDPRKREVLAQQDSLLYKQYPGFGSFAAIPRVLGAAVFPTYKRNEGIKGADNPCIKLQKLTGNGYRKPKQHSYWEAVELCIRCYYEKAWKEMEKQLKKEAKEQQKKPTAFKPMDAKTKFFGTSAGLSTKGDVQVYKNKNDGSADVNIKVPYEMGWLDRIGYKADQGASIDSIDYTDVADVAYADHSVIIRVCEVTWPDPPGKGKAPKGGVQVLPPK